MNTVNVNPTAASDAASTAAVQRRLLAVRKSSSADRPGQTAPFEALLRQAGGKADAGPIANRLATPDDAHEGTARDEPDDVLRGDMPTDPGSVGTQSLQPSPPLPPSTPPVGTNASGTAFLGVSAMADGRISESRRFEEALDGSEPSSAEPILDAAHDTAAAPPHTRLSATPQAMGTPVGSRSDGPRGLSTERLMTDSDPGADPDALQRAVAEGSAFTMPTATASRREGGKPSDGVDRLENLDGPSATALLQGLFEGSSTRVGAQASESAERTRHHPISGIAAAVAGTADSSAGHVGRSAAAHRNATASGLNATSKLSQADRLQAPSRLESAPDTPFSASFQTLLAPGKVSSLSPQPADPADRASPAQASNEWTAGQPPSMAETPGIAGSDSPVVASPASAMASGIDRPPPHAVPEGYTAARMETPITDDAFPRVLGLSIGRWIDEEVQRVWLEVHPADMGPVAIRMDLDGTRAELNFGVESAAARQIIESCLPDLASSLQASGLTLSGGSIWQDMPQPGTGNPSTPERGARQDAGGRPGDANLGIISGPARVTTPRGLLDLYA